MKYAKMLGLLAVAATALMAFAATASATVVTAPAGTAYTGTIKAVNTGTLVLNGVVDIECNKSEVEGEVKSHGSSVTAEGPISKLTFTECNHHVESPVSVRGTLIAHSTGTTHQATLTSNGAEVSVTATTIFGAVHCVFVTKNTDIGTLTSGKEHATLHITSAAIPVDTEKSSGLCGSSATWNGDYKVTSPTNLTID